MKIYHSLLLAGLSSILGLTVAPSSQARPDAAPTTPQGDSIAVAPAIDHIATADMVVTARTILPSKVRPSVPLAVIAAKPTTAAAPSVMAMVKPEVMVTTQPDVMTGAPKPAAVTKPEVASKPAPAPSVVVPTVAQTTAPAAPTPSAPQPTPPSPPPVAPQPPATPLPPTQPVQPVAPVVTPPPTTPPTAPPPASTTPPSPVPVPAPRDPRAALPEYLNPDPNPLQFPTKPEEVTLKGYQPISLKAAIDLAERNNRTLEQARIQLDRSQSSLREAQADRFPSIFVQGDLTRSKSASTELGRRAQLNNLEGALGRDAALRQLQDADDPQTTFNTSVQISYDLITGGRRSGQIKAAERQVRLSELEVERILEQTRLDVTEDYYNLQEADEQVITNTAAVTSAQSNLKDAQAQFEAGLGTKFDVLRAQVQLANSQQQLTSAIATRDVRRRQLAQRLSLRESVGVRASDPVSVAGAWNWSMEETLVRAYKSRVELEQQLVQREISEARRKVALATLKPTVTLNAQGNLLEVFEDSLGVAFGSGYSLSAQARWQLFDGGAARARAAQQDKDKELAESRFAEARNAIRFEVERAYTTLLANQASIQTTEAAVRQAEEALRLAILRFQAGVGTQTDRINAEADLTRARGNRTAAIIGYNRSLAQLKRSVSNLATRQ